MKVRMLVIVGFVAAAAAFGIVLLLPTPAAGEGWDALWWLAPLAAVLAVVPLWHYTIERPGRRSTVRGALVGVAAGVAAHPLTFYLMALSLFVGGARDSFGEPTADPLTAVPISLVLALWSLLILGLPTIVLGALGGGLLAMLSRRLHHA